MTSLNFFRTAIAAATCSMLFTACGDDSSSNSDPNESGEIVSISDKAISGVSQKGPFVTGSTVTLYELDENFKQTGKNFAGDISSDDGAFKIDAVELASQYTFLKANGYYRNEVTGKKSAGVITLNALTDLSDREKVNVNLLTHLEYERAMYLVQNDTLSVAEAKVQAEKEIFKAFGIEGDFDNSEDLDIFNKGEGNAALLAISVLMQGDRSDAELTEFLKKFASDIKEDGIWDDEKSKIALADWALNAEVSGNLAKIRENIEGWKLGEVPAFEKVLYKFWTSVLEFSTCDKDANGKVVAVEKQLSEHVGSKLRLICKDNIWVTASDVEKDTYGWEAAKPGDINSYMKRGTITETLYVYDTKAGKWREPYDVENIFASFFSTDDFSIVDAFKHEENKPVPFVCTDDIEGKYRYLQYKKGGSYRCVMGYDDGDDYNYVTKPIAGVEGSYLDSSYSVPCDLHAYVCENWEWKEIDARVPAIESLVADEGDGSPEDLDGAIAFRYYQWFKYDFANGGWVDANETDVAMLRAVGERNEARVRTSCTVTAAKNKEMFRLTEEEFGKQKVFTYDPVKVFGEITYQPNHWTDYVMCYSRFDDGSYNVWEGLSHFENSDGENDPCTEERLEETKRGVIVDSYKYKCSKDGSSYRWMNLGEIVD